MPGRRSYRFPYARYPAVRIALLLIAGILIDRFAVFPYWFLLIIFSGFTFLLISLELINRKKMSRMLPVISSGIYFLIIISFGWIRMEIHQAGSPSLTTQLLKIAEWEQVEGKAEVAYIGKNSAGKLRADVVMINTRFSGRMSTSEQYRGRLLLEGEDFISEGDTIHFTGTIIPVSEKRNPHQFDYKAYLKSRGIETQIRLDSLISHQQNSTILSWYGLRKEALSLTEQNFDDLTAPIAKALLLGYKQDLEGVSKQAFARAGLSHIMAVSGLHVGFIIAPFWLIIPLLWTKKYGRQIGFAILIFVLWFYAGLTGFSASVMRASLTAVLLTAGKLFYRSSDSINLTAVAAIILLIIDPSELFKVGFQLSFCAVLIILLVLPVIQHGLPYWVRVRWYAAPVMIVIVSVVVQLGLYPVQVYYFGEVSLISPLANALFVPFLGLIVPFALICIFITAVIPPVGFFLNYPALFFLQLMNAFVLKASGWEWSWAEASLPTMLLFPFWLTVIFFIASWRMPSLRWKFLLMVMLLVSSILAEHIIKKFEPGELKVTIFDVGQGDAALIETPNGKSVLVDAGVWSPGYNSGKSVLMPYFKEAGIHKLDAVILSHPHADHIGGIVDLIEGTPIDTIYNSGYEYESSLYRNYLALAGSKQIPVKSLKAGDRLNIDEAVLMLVLGPEGRRLNENPNQHSVVINMIYGETEFLFTGDSEENQEERLVENYGGLLDTDFLKVGHHGSRTSSGTKILEEITPEIAVVSLAERNRFRHPHAEAIRRLQATGTQLYFTSRDRALIFISDGKQIRQERWN